jgi:hypothetical protein
MNWCLIIIGFQIGVAAGLIRLAYLIGYSNGNIAGMSYASELMDKAFPRS